MDLNVIVHVDSNDFFDALPRLKFKRNNIESIITQIKDDRQPTIVFIHDSIAQNRLFIKDRRVYSNDNGDWFKSFWDSVECQALHIDTETTYNNISLLVDEIFLKTDSLIWNIDTMIIGLIKLCQFVLDVKSRFIVMSIDLKKQLHITFVPDNNNALDYANVVMDQFNHITTSKTI